MIGTNKPFIVNADNELVINSNALLGIHCFEHLCRRVNKIEGDADGRKKVQNYREMKYIYFMTDYDSLHKGLTDFDRSNKCKLDAKLSVNWQPDALVLECITKYQEIIDYYIPSARILISINRALSMSATAVDSYATQMEMVIRMNTDKMKANKNLDPIELMEIMESNKVVQANINEILNIGTKLPKTLEALVVLEDKVRKEVSAAAKLQGDKTKRNREDPK